MLFSIYPTDDLAIRDAVVAQASAQPGERLVFTSLHIPESEGLHQYGAYLQSLHRNQGLVFCGDVSPGTLAKLGIGIDEVGLLREWGIVCLRIDYGFDADEIRRIAATGDFAIAVNASTADAHLVDSLAGLRVVGWHNYYPRPETGLTVDFYRAQNSLFAERGMDVYGFLPGEVTFRGPLFAGLPMLEDHRHRNAWRNFLELRRVSPQVRLVCAEGVLADDHLSWIGHVEATGEVTVPVADLDPSVEFLRNRSWHLRVEGTEASLRVEGTRSARTPARLLNADLRARGSVQMDLDGYGRYCGEIHLMRTDRPLTPLQARVGQIAGAYLGMIDELQPGMSVRFV